MNTMQQEFDAVVKHLYTQGRKARSDTKCLYRAEVDGKVLSCAVGCRIPDDVYNPEMDKAHNFSGTGISTIIERYPAPILPPEIYAYRSLFEALQVEHDTAKVNEDGTFDMASLEIRLKQTAVAYGLTFTAPEVA